MRDIALYRLPERKEYHVVEGFAKELKDIGEIEGREGFVLAPFNIGGANPLLFIEAENTEVKEVPEASVENAKGTIIKEDNYKEEYHKHFEIFHDYLDNGKVDKIVLSRRLDLTMNNDVDVKDVFFTACRMYPHQMIALISTRLSGTWLMATPEVLLEKDYDSWKTMALAGTMTTPGPWSEKNKKEQQYVSEYIYNCLKRYSSKVRYSSPHTVSAAKLYHIRTDFTFDVNSDKEAINILKDFHPTPAVCGLPKVDAFNIILGNESFDRKYYSGFCGPFNIKGDTHLFVSLRCMEIDGNTCHLYAGGGLLKESVEQTEWKETEVKLKTMKDVLG